MKAVAAIRKLGSGVISSRNYARPQFTRREWIARTGLGVAGLALTGCATRRTPAAPSIARALSPRPFVRPRIQPDQIIRTVVGLRPYRPSGFVVRGERMGEKVVIHNYGH